MCILFVYINNDCQASDGYQLIIANNRDEFYDRPTKPAGKWGDDDTFISGRDMQPGREGGTWLGLSTRGRFASLLNILVEKVDPNKKGRGFLVTDFLKSEINADKYVQPIDAEKEQYNGFNLVMLNRLNKNWKLTYYSNLEPTSPYTVESGSSGYGNAIHKTPWQKVDQGTTEFDSICSRYNRKETKSELRENLLDFLNDPRPHLPDPVLELQNNYMSKYCRERSCRHVKIPDIKYGTRTNTVILIDKDGYGEYLERTIKEPIDLNKPNWETTIIPFKLQ